MPRAVHLEVMEDKTFTEVLLGVRGVFARRGKPVYVFCNKSKEKIRANVDIDSLWENVSPKKISKGFLQRAYVLTLTYITRLLLLGCMNASSAP